MKKLLIATENRGKLIELQELLNGMDVELILPSSLGLSLGVEETGHTYAENAALKAVAYAKASGLIALADDSGLEVDALDGAPGLYSARYAPIPKATDGDRRAYLLKNLQGKPRPWLAQFHATIAVSDGSQVRFAEGKCPGEIIPEERGSGGFGYDPIFFIPETNCTMAELALGEKNCLSHRARAVQNAKGILKEMLGL